MKKIYSILCFCIISSVAFAQTPDSTKAPVDTSWKTGGFININTSQTGFSNWAAGGQNSFAFTGTLNLFANYRKDKIEWSNGLILGYGTLTTGSVTRKSNDQIDLTTKFGRQTSEHWYLAVLGEFKSQFTKGYNYPNDSVVVSNFLAPAYVLASLGYDFKPNDDFSLFLSPATGRFIIVDNQQIANAGTYGNTPAVFATDGVTVITPGKESKSEFGAYVKAAYKKKIMENITLLAKVDLFNDYTASNGDNKNVVVNGELLLSLKVNKYISASVDVVTIYDNDVDTDPTAPGVQRRLQLEDVIGVGLSYQF